MTPVTYSQAFQQGMHEEMTRNDRIFVLGTDLLDRGGHFGQVLGLGKEFGAARVRDMPISEAAMVAAGVGAALNGMRPVVDLNFIDFSFGAMDEIANQAAKMRYMFGTPLPLVIRGTSGVALYAAQHNNSLEATFAQMPGLLVAVPSTPADTKGLLKTALRGEDPVVFMMHKKLSGTRGEVGGPEELVPFGQAVVRRVGGDVTIVAYSQMVFKAMEAAASLAASGIEAEVIDLRTVMPLDFETVAESVRKTGRLVAVTEAPCFGSIAAEVAARIQETVFDWLAAPVVRVGAKHAPIAHSPTLYESVIPQAADIDREARALVNRPEIMSPLLVIAEGTIRETALEEAHLAGRAQVRLTRIDSPEQVREATRDAQAVLVTTNPLTAAHIAALGEGVRVIGRAGTGLDAIDLEAARARGLFVYHTPDYCTNEVATHALALILAVQRRVIDADRQARTEFSGWRALTPIPALDALTAGVVGGGRIGRAVMARLLPFVKRVVMYDPYVDSAPEGVERLASLDELLRRSDIVTLHMPLTAETRGMIGTRELGLLPDGAIVVNVSRGGLVDEADLRAALEGGRLAGAALDVLTSEPPRPDDQIMGAPRLLLSPHLAWYSSESERRVRTQVLDGVLACLAGTAPQTGRIAVDPRGAEVR